MFGKLFGRKWHDPLPIGFAFATFVAAAAWLVTERSYAALVAFFSASTFLVVALVSKIA